MKLKVGDVVEFKNYEDISGYDNAILIGKDFPESGKVTSVNHNGYFCIEGSPYNFYSGSVARVISDVDDCDLVIKEGDEVLVKATVNGVFVDKVRISSQIKKSDVIKILKRKTPEHFIVQEDHYGMYISSRYSLSSAKIEAKVYNSRIEANENAADMHLNAWDLIPYGD